MLLREMKEVLYSPVGEFQTAVVWDADTRKVVVEGCSIEYAIGRFGDWQVVRIRAVENSIVLSVSWVEMMEGKGFDETEFLKEFTREA